MTNTIKGYNRLFHDMITLPKMFYLDTDKNTQ